MSVARVQRRKLPPCIIMVMGTALGLHHAGIHLCSLSGKQYGSALVLRVCVWDRERVCVPPRVCVCAPCSLMNVIFHALTLWRESVCLVLSKIINSFASSGSGVLFYFVLFIYLLFQFDAV